MVNIACLMSTVNYILFSHYQWLSRTSSRQSEFYTIYSLAENNISYWNQRIFSLKILGNWDPSSRVVANKVLNLGCSGRMLKWPAVCAILFWQCSEVVKMPQSSGMSHCLSTPLKSRTIISYCINFDNCHESNHMKSIYCDIYHYCKEQFPILLYKTFVILPIPCRACFKISNWFRKNILVYYTYYFCI